MHQSEVTPLTQVCACLPPQYAIAAIVADGADNIFTVAIDEAVRFDGSLNIYQTTPAGVTTKVLADYQDPNAITNADGLAADNDGPGAIGGSGAGVLLLLKRKASLFN